MLATNSHQRTTGHPQLLMDDSLPSISLEDDPSLLYPHQLDPNHRPNHSPSPSHSASPPIDIPYTSLPDFHPSPSPSNFNFPGTPSYQGSFNGSYGSERSPSHNWGGRADGDRLNLFDDNPDDYNPSEYDIPDNSSNMYAQPEMSPFDLIDDNFDFSSATNPTVSVVPADTVGNHNERSIMLGDASPASSRDDPRSPSPMRSRASSIASSHGSPNGNRKLSDNQSQSLEPQWGVTAPSPPASAQSPANGSRSPPALVIPDATNNPNNHLAPGSLFPPNISPHGGPGLAPPTQDGPGINLIPATPISGGGNGVTAVPFSRAFDPVIPSNGAHNSSESSQRPGSSHSNSSQHNLNHSNPIDVHMWAPQPDDPSRGIKIRVPSPSPSPGHSSGFMGNPTLTSQHNIGFTNAHNAVSTNSNSPYHRPSPSASPHPSPLQTTLDLAAGQPSQSMGGGVTGHTLSVPVYPKRERSKSETFSQRPAWALGVANYPTGANNSSNVNGVNNSSMMTFGLQNQPQQSRTVNPIDISPADHPLSFMTSSSTDPFNPHFSRPDFPDLPPNLNHVNTFGPGLTPSHGGYYENLGTSDMYLSVDQNAAMRRSRSDAGGHRRGAKSEDFTRSPDFHNLSPNLVTDRSGLLAPPNHPSLMVPSDQYGRGRSSDMTHHRRASSGSRGHERHGSGSVASSARASPYPSPSTSPMVGYATLQPDVSTVNMTGLNIREGVGANGQMVDVARPHVTTSATQAASAIRRTSEATFTCPVPGCGSTFTRHFNLKGHMRSHNDERPFRCKWPGCEKGFARQHDCKRHEQLHLNIRPYNCEGCNRTFARMDALNRHLRSEGGAECAKHQQPLTEERIPKEEESWPSGNGTRQGAVLT